MRRCHPGKQRLGSSSVKKSKQSLPAVGQHRPKEVLALLAIAKIRRSDGSCADRSESRLPIGAGLPRMVPRSWKPSQRARRRWNPWCDSMGDFSALAYAMSSTGSSRCTCAPGRTCQSSPEFSHCSTCYMRTWRWTWTAWIDFRCDASHKAGRALRSIRSTETEGKAAHAACDRDLRVAHGWLSVPPFEAKGRIQRCQVLRSGQGQVKIFSSPQQKIRFCSPWHVPCHLPRRWSLRVCSKTLPFRRLLAQVSTKVEAIASPPILLVRKVCCRAPQCQLRPQPQFDEPFQACQQLSFRI